MDIHAKCTWDYEAIKALSHLSSYRKANPRNRLIFTGVMAGLVLVLTLVHAVLWGGTGTLQLLFFALVLLGFDCFVMFALPKITYKNLCKFQNSQHFFHFSDNTVKIVSRGEAYNGESEVQYAMLVKAYETSKYFFLFQMKNQTYIVDKSTVTGGTEADIRGKIQPLLGKKYKVCKY